MKYIAWIWHNTRGIRGNSAVRIVAGIVRVLLGLLMVWLCKSFIDVTIRTGSSQDIIVMIILLILTVLGGILLRQAYYYMTISANTIQSNNIRIHLFSLLFNRELFQEQDLHSGDVASRMTKDIEVVSNATTSTIPDLIITGFQLVGAFLLLYSMDKNLAWVILLLTPIAIAFGKLISNRLRKMTLDIRKDESRIQMQIQEGMELNAILRALNSEDWITDRLDSLQQKLKGNMMRRARFTVFMRITFGIAFGLGYMLAFIWGGLQLRSGAITFGVMTSFLQLVGQIQQPILSLLNTLTSLIHTTASIDRLEELESETTSPIDSFSSSDDKDTFLSPAGVEAKDVCFHYATGDRMVINHFTHSFLPGSKTALMGPTGIGKTTLFRMMLALIRPDSGCISIYINKVEEHVSENTRKYFVYVPQGNTLMSGSIRFNLLLANPNATDEQLKEVLQTAVAEFVFDLPDGLDTDLGERGGGLSEGQAQRIAIARGLLRPGNILLLDEISASLDEQTEQLLYTRLFKKYPHKTMIFITHRSSVSELCDDVIHIK